MRPGITVCTPSIPPRARKLVEAVASVLAQERPADAISVAVDVDADGPAVTRNRALAASDTEWTAFLDDDDLMNPEHLRLLLDAAEDSGADLVYPWFTVSGGSDPFPAFFGRPWRNDDPHIFPVTYLVRTELAKDVGGFPEPEWLDPAAGIGEDWAFILALIAVDAKILHLPERTWTWRHWGGNTSGVRWTERQNVLLARD